MSDGGYDEGYRVCPCFWGESPAQMVNEAIELFGGATNKRALDLGCGEGKNAAALARSGFRVVAIDKSPMAIENAMGAFGAVDVSWLVCDLAAISGPADSYDLIIATGSLHCLDSAQTIEQVVGAMRRMTKRSGVNVLSSFNDGPQDMRGHSSDFRPTLLPHARYLRMYEGWEVLRALDATQRDVHPHNQIEHSHSITRLIVRKIV